MAESNNQLKIGIITPLTGGVAKWGQSVRNGIEIANAESAFKAKLIFQDEGSCIPRKALSAFNYLVNIANVDIVVGSCLEGAQAIAPLAKKQNIPFFIAGRSTLEFQSVNQNALSWLSLLDYEGEAISELIVKRKWKRGSSVVWSGYFGIQFAKSIENAILKNKLDFKLTKNEFSQDSLPNATDVLRIIKQKPDVVFLMLAEPSAAFLVKQLRLFKYKGEIILQSSMLQTYNKDVRKDFVGAIQQKFFIDNDKFLNLKNIISKKLGEDVADDFVFSYDAFKVLLKQANACSQADKIFLSCLNDNLRNEEWRAGVSGKYKFMGNGSTLRPMVFRVISEYGFNEIK